MTTWQAVILGGLVGTVATLVVERAIVAIGRWLDDAWRWWPL